MDIACPRCGEPFGLDELHEYVGETIVLPPRGTQPGGAEVRIQSFKQAKDIFYSYGCGVLMTGNRCTRAEDEASKTRATFSSALHDLMGDDVDGIASGLEDAEYFGLI